MALSTTHTFALHKINEKEYIKVFKKVKKILPILLAMVMLFGSCLTVFAVSNVPNEHDAACLEKMVAYNATLNKESYPYQMYTRSYYETDEKYYTRLYFSDMPLTSYYISNTYDTYVGVSSGCEYYYVDYAEPTETLKCSDVYNATKDGFIGASLTILSANYRIDLYTDGVSTGKYYPSNESFFPKPPIATAARPLVGAVKNQTGIILTIAIGLLASLIILSVLPKKLPLFLKR